MPTVTTPSEVVDRLFREQHGRAVATLIRVLGDFDLAEESLQDAYLVAIQKWPASGVPANPAAWIVTTARNRAIDRLRRAKRLTDKEAILRHRGGSRRGVRGGGIGGRGGRRGRRTDVHPR